MTTYATYDDIGVDLADFVADLRVATPTAAADPTAAN